VAAHDQSLVTKFGVQFGLFGGSIYLLGTERHHARYLRDVGTLALPGCFAMSELGHGSNVRELETEAVFDPAAREFVIHTPRESARKEWIGNAARHGRMAVVFAQLVVDGERHGVHAFLVPIRAADGTVMPGVRIEDNGAKGGLNGVDNGRIWFDRVRVPRENLLNRWADVLPDGTYTSTVANPSRRFFTMLGTLVGGRMSVALSSLSVAKVGLTIAIRYGAVRRQFGPAEGAEIPLLDYRTHQRRLFPALATVYATDFALKALVRRFLDPARRGERELEANAAGLKAFTTWHTLETLQAARE
jgi:acyl-CoA oxidase